MHYSRDIENQLDAVHLPFVHATTIGRGHRTLIYGPLVRWVEEQCSRMNIWVYSDLDEGQPAMKPDPMGTPSRRPSLQFQFPNIWHNWIGDEVRVMAAFVPIDEENTRM